MNDQPSPNPPLRYIGDVQRLHLEPGDVIVLKTPRTLRLFDLAETEKLMRMLFPDNKYVILGPGYEFSIIAPAETEL